MDPDERSQLKTETRRCGQRASFIFGWFPKRMIVAVVAVLLSGLVMTNHSGAQALSEYQIKAAFLFNFAKFVEWPPTAFSDPAAPLILGIVGEDPFGPALEQTVMGKTVNNRSLVIKRFSNRQTLEPCHILFVSQSEQGHLAQIIAAVRSSNTLTVSETEQFLDFGGMVNFLTVGNKIRFEIYQGAAERAGLRLSSKLLSLAATVRTDG